MTKKQKKILFRIIAATVMLAVIWAVTSFVYVNRWIQLGIYMVPYIVIGYDILRKAVKGIIKGRIFDENFLMAIATVGAMALGEYREGVAVMLFYQVGELFQSCAVGKSRKNIAALMDIRPDYANVMSEGKIERVSPEDVKIGTEIIINPGEKIPIDGIVTYGSTTLNTSALTGESVPREAEEGSQVISGCINMTGVIHVRTTKEFGESTVAKILDLVENSSMKKSRSENFITRFAKYYTPAVCGSALALAVLPPLVRLITGASPMWQTWIIRALTFLVISCPCALVISIPLSFFGGIGCASSNGILVKGSNYLEALAKTGIIVFDKTGTITKGVFEVTGMRPSGDMDNDRLLYYAAHAESASGHPISKSIVKAYGKDIDSSAVSDIKEIAGHGVSAVVKGHDVLAGNTRLMEENGISSYEECDDTTAVYVAVDGKYAGCIMISDVIKASSPKAVDMLKARGIKTVILTGDSKKAAEKAALEAGVDMVKSGLLPADKVSEVEELLSHKGRKETLAFVGDGINDAPVLSRADVGIAMGALGSDAAIEAADIVLMDDDPAKIPLAMKIAEKTLRIVYENIIFALAVKLICLILGAVGIANMWMAIFADVGVMVIAVINAMRALKIKKSA